MRFSTLTSIRRIAGQIRLGLANDTRTSSLALSSMRPRVSDTGGHCVSIAQLDSGIRAEIWLDLYPGAASPRFWAGFSSSLRTNIERLIALGSRAGVGEVAIRRYSRDVHSRRGISQFRSPLASDQFDVQILESYTDTFFLGMYLPYPWPLVRKDEQSIARDSVNYIAALSSAYLSAGLSSRGRTVGPWNRPDKAVEVAAVNYVRAKLHRRGYRVRNRQHEICGYDLHATRNGKELHVEVKGISGEDPRFFISRTELKAAERDPFWKLALVLRARTKPRMARYISGKRVRLLFDMQPTQWFATARRAITP